MALEQWTSVWKNGDYLDPGAVPMNPSAFHGTLYWSSVFEGIRFYNTSDGRKIFRLDDHIERLFGSMSTLDIEITQTRSDMKTICENLVSKCDWNNWYIRPTISPSVSADGALAVCPIGTQTDVEVLVKPLGQYAPNNSLNVQISEKTRPDPGSAYITAKIGGTYWVTGNATTKARKAWFDEALLLDERWYIAESPSANIFFVNDDQEVWTPTTHNILAGITRDTVIQLLSDKFGIQVSEVDMTPEELGKAKEAFFTGTAIEITAIESISDRDGNRSVYNSSHENSLTKKIQQLYNAVVRGEKPGYEQWLS